MNIFIILIITIIWLLSVYFFASWRIRSREQNGHILAGTIHDRATHSYVMASGAALLAFIIYLI